MARSYVKEIEALPETIRWSFEEPLPASFEKMVSTISPYPLIVVGSGGSLSGAHFVARLHEQVTGNMAYALTPLELLSSKIDPYRHAVILLTSTGNNKDILNTFDIAVKKEFQTIGLICASINSRILKKAKSYPYVLSAEFRNPAGREGFLAVNSLISTCILAARAYKALDVSNDILRELIGNEPDLDTPEWKQVFDRTTIAALGSGWGWPALIDIESKFTEAALRNVIITDFRNFGHGRHNWFDKKGDETALVALETPKLKLLVKKTIKYLPENYPRAALCTSFNGPLGGIDLLKQVFHLTGKVGKLIGIDPGRPKVPEFGRKIYSIGLSPVVSKRKVEIKKVWLARKSRVSGMPVDALEKHLDKFLAEIKQTIFSGIVFDYDGTLCDPPERFSQPKDEIALSLNEILSNAIYIGIATGRGNSVQKSLKKVIEKKYWEKVIIGNYNGSYILPLSNKLPKHRNIYPKTISDAAKFLDDDSLIKGLAEIKVREKQISILAKPGANAIFIFKRVMEILNNENNIKIVRSDHSIDIIDADTSKLYVIEALDKMLSKNENNILIIGDQGQYGGNDFEMLKESYSLSVNKVSSSPDTCWNLSPAGIQGATATVSILRNMIYIDRNFKIDIDSLYKQVIK